MAKLTRSEHIQDQIQHYLKHFAQGEYLYHWTQGSPPTYLNVMSYCGQGLCQVGGMPIPVGHWAHQLMQGPPADYLDVLTAKDACSKMEMHPEDLDKLLDALSQAIEKDEHASL